MTVKKYFSAHFHLIALILSAVCFLALFLMAYRLKSSAPDSLPINNGWNVQHNQTIIATDGVLSKLKLPDTAYGDVVTLTTTLPQKLLWDNPEFMIHCYHSAMEVYVGETLCYKYAMDRHSERKFAGSGYHVISLPDNYMGKELQIRIYPIETNALSSFKTPSLYPANQAIHSLSAKRGVAWIVGLFLLMLGPLIQIITYLLSFHMVSVMRMYFVGLFSFLIGLWSVCYFNFWQLFDMPVYEISTIENCSLFFAAIPIMLYFYRDVCYVRRRFVLHFYQLLLIAETVFAVVACILHFTNLLHFKGLLTALHVFQLISVLTIFYCILQNFRRRHRADQIQMIGIALACTGVLLDLGVYEFIVFLSGTPSSNFSFTAIGTLCFVLCLLVAFVIESMINFTKRAENEILKKFAYTDELTALGNRHACEAKLKQVESSRDANYGVISIDLNNLKTTNDTLGHSAGDIMLKTFANLLRDSFEKYGFIGRMGGDEFLIVIDNAREFDYAQELEDFQKLLKKRCEDYNEALLTASFGYAEASEWKECTAHEVYSTADNRMYESKRRFKANANSSE